MLQGSKIRSTYVAFAQKEKKRLEQELEQTEQEIAVREKEVARLKGNAYREPAKYRRLTITSTRSCREDRVPFRRGARREETVA